MEKKKERGMYEIMRNSALAGLTAAAITFGGMSCAPNRTVPADAAQPFVSVSDTKGSSGTQNLVEGYIRVFESLADGYTKTEDKEIMEGLAKNGKRTLKQKGADEAWNLFDKTYNSSGGRFDKALTDIKKTEKNTREQVLCLEDILIGSSIRFSNLAEKYNKEGNTQEAGKYATMAAENRHLLSITHAALLESRGQKYHIRLMEATELLDKSQKQDVEILNLKFANNTTEKERG